MPTILNIIENTKEGAFKAGVYSLFDAYEYKEMDNKFSSIGEIDISELSLSNDRYSIGKIKRNNSNSKKIEIVNVSDGAYCANGTLEELDIIKGDCSNLDITAPVINNISIEKTTSSINVIVSFSEPDSFIDGYEFRLLDNNDNVVRDWESGDTLTGSGNNRVTTKTYTGLTQNTTYKVEVRITNTSDSENNSVTDNETVTLNSFNTPEISYNTEDYELSKTVTLTYDSGVTTRYKIVDNDLNTIVAWTTLGGTNDEITISNYDYTVIIESTDGTTTLSNSSVIGYIDLEAPTITLKDPGSATITELSNNVIINTYFNVNSNGGASITSTSCVDTSNSNAVVTNTNTLSIGTHDITCTATKSTGLSASETKTIVVESAIYAERILNGATPELYIGLIPVMIENNGTVKVADLATTWYSYTNKKWANAVTVNNATYRTATPGTIIPEANILTYYVWVPRYKYLLFNANNERKPEQQITIVFENKDTIKSNGVTNGTYLTHPAFTFGSKELNGIWVSKFEATGSTTALTSKPNSYSILEKNISTMFIATRNMEKLYNIYGFTSETGTLNSDGTYTTNINGIDSHMMKNTEWGAIAYLTQSIYGKCSDGTCNDIGINNYYSNNAAMTGCGNVPNSSATTTCNSYINALASTTQNIYGIYDMSGGGSEYVMGNAKNSSGNFNPSSSGFTTTPNSKYYNAYDYSNSYESHARGFLGDATKETLSTFGLYAGGWNHDFAYFPYGGEFSHTWFTRGHNHSASYYAGIWTFGYYTGGPMNEFSFRFVLTAE